MGFIRATNGDPLAPHLAAANPHPQYLSAGEVGELTGGMLSLTGNAPALANASAQSRIGWGISSGNAPFLFFINRLAPAGAKIVDFILDQFGNFYFRRLNDNYSPAGAIKNVVRVDADGNAFLLEDLEVGGFLKFGDRAVRLRTVTGVAHSSQNTYKAFPHGLSGAEKIIRCDAVVYTNGLAMPPNHPVPAAGCTYSIYCDASNLVMYLPANTAANVVGREFVATILYVE